MGTPSVLKRLGDKASSYYSSLKSLPPGDSEYQGLKANQENVDAVTEKHAAPAPAAPQKDTKPAKVDLVTPTRHYGDRPGEKVIDTKEMLKPLGSSTPVYDNGGEVTEAQRLAIAPLGKSQGAPQSEAQRLAVSPLSKLGGGTPVYDEGGDVDVNDGEHQTAILKEGERVLTPEQNEQYKAEHPEVAEATPTDTLKLKPYGQVMEDKAKAKATEMVNNPGAQTKTSEAPEEKLTPREQPAEEKPKLTYGHILADQWLKQNGLTSITDTLKAPKELNQGAQTGVDESGMTAPSALQQPAATKPGLKPIVQPTPAAPVSGKEAYNAKIAEYDKAYQDLMDKAAASNDPQYKEQAARIQEAKLAYQKAHPWGAKESAHPGVLGKIGHVAEQVLSRAPITSSIAATIPGSEGYRAAQKNAAQEEVKEANAENAADNKASALPGYHQVTGGAIDPLHPELGPQVAFENEKNPKDIVYQGPITQKGAGGDKTAFQKTLAKIGTAEVADPDTQRAAIEQAHTDKKITDEEYANANAYLGSTANAPATQSAAASEKKMKGAIAYYDTPNGRVGMTEAEAKKAGLKPEDGYVVSAGQAEKDREKDKTFNVINKSLGQYQKHIDESKITPKDIEVMTTLTEEAESPDYISKLLTGVFDDLLGHPVTGYSEKLMKGTLTKNQYQDMSQPARQLIADYYTVMMAHFANMKASQGSLPRNPTMIHTEMLSIPRPYLSPDEAAPAFKDYEDALQWRNSDNVKFNNPTKAEEPAVKPAVKPTARPEGVPENASHIYRDGEGNIVGYAQDGKYHALETK